MQSDELTAIAVAVGVLAKPAPLARRHRIPFEHVSPSAARVREYAHAAQDEEVEPLWLSICGALVLVVIVWVLSLLVWVMGGVA